MCSRVFALLLFATVVRGATPEIDLPARAAAASGGRAFAERIAALDREAREAAVRAEIERGNVPAWWRRFVEVKLGDATILVAPDYLAVGSDEDYFLVPLSPGAAQGIADRLGCVLPTRRMVEAIHRAAPLQLEPAPIPPSAAMTTVKVFAEHNAMVRAQRLAAGAAHPPGTLVAGHKKDIVITPRLAAAPGKVAIYGWHRSDGSAIQPLYLGHTDAWVDYSHGVRLVRRAMTVNGKSATVPEVLADPARAALLSDEGPVAEQRYRVVRTTATETTEELRFEPGVRVVLNAPARIDPAQAVRLVLFAAPAGNSIEHTIGRRTQPGDDWHFDIQHVGAQTRWLRERGGEPNLVVAYLQADERSFVLWRRKHADHPARIVAIVDALRARFAAPKIVLTGHSAGGGFTFGFLDGVEHIPDDIERIAFLDSNYAYDATKGHAAKLAGWLRESDTHRLVVLAYEDHVALLNGKTFVSANGGTWGRSHAMLGDLAREFPFGRDDVGAGLQRHRALGGRVEFLLKENPEKAVLHTRQVELNGFIHALLAGTERAGKDYDYLGPRAYAEWIRE